MKVKAIKTIKGQAPMQEYHNYTVLDDDGRENFLVCIFPDIEYQEIKGFGALLPRRLLQRFISLVGKTEKK